MAKRAPSPTTSVRSSGVLLHVTSLPSPYGIGDLGPIAQRWIDLLADAKQHWWQILPLNPPDGSHSPYSAHSAFAGNSALISPDLLLRDGLITRAELPKKMPAGKYVDFDKVLPRKRSMVAAATERLSNAAALRSIRREYQRFVEAEKDWLEDWVLFMSLREHRPEVPWSQWPKALLNREQAAIREAQRALATEIERHRVAQFLFYRQLKDLRDHAADRGVRLMGDVPIYVSGDSADVWANPEMFQLDKRRQPTAVAGVPPDLFSKEGQRWGNPLYDWDAMKADGFRWWIARLRSALRHADVIRIDHFRGLAAYWRIPASAPTAVKGKWVKAPGAAMLETVCQALGDLPLVAEDLGLITPDVIELRDQFKMPGMQVMQFAFGDGPENTALPHNFRRQTIVYSGNHDNDTTVGWFKKLPKQQRKHATAYAPELEQDPSWAMIRLAWASVADSALVTMQDVLELDSDCRFNDPGMNGGAPPWSWRMSEAQMKDKRMKRLAEMTELYGRVVSS